MSIPRGTAIGQDLTHDIFDPASPEEWLSDFKTEIAAMKKEFGDAVQLPPNCFLDMEGRFVRYESRKLLVVRIPVRERSFNPTGVMQGGYLAAGFDNTIGPLSYLAARRPCMTLDLHVQFIRAAGPGDLITFTARVVSRGATTIVLGGEAHNQKNKLVALATATAIGM